jgi:alpha-tubulin suppressor-like RCC1 family protein
LFLAQGLAFSWGKNEFGQLGDGTAQNKLVPTAVDVTGALLNKKVSSVSCGHRHSISLLSDGSIATWGLNVNGILFLFF